MFDILGFLTDITEDNKIWLNILFFKNGKKEAKMNMNVLFMRLNLNLLYGAQGSINIWGEKINWNYICFSYLELIYLRKGIDWKNCDGY